MRVKNLEKSVISIVFLLLISACNTLKPEKFEPQISKESTPQITENLTSPENLIIIEIKSDGRIFLDKKNAGTINNLGELEKDLTALLDKRKLIAAPDARAVVVKSVKSMKYGEVVKVLDLARSLGASPIAMQIDESVK